MEIPDVPEHSRPVKKPVAATRNVARPTAPPPPVRASSASVNGVTTSSPHRAGKLRGGVQTIPFHKATDAALAETSFSPVKTSSTRSSLGNTPPLSSSTTAARSTSKPGTNSVAITNKSVTNSHFLKLATTRCSPGPKPKLPTKPAALRDNPTLILARKSGTAATNNVRKVPLPTEASEEITTLPNSSTSSPLTVCQPQKTTSLEGDLPGPISPSIETRDNEKKNWFSARSMSSPGKTAASGTGAKLLVQGPPSRQTSLHARLPSTDSGIQADGGFDSLSRYKGKSFLSDSSATFDSLEGSDDLLSSFCTLPSTISSDVAESDSVFQRDLDKSINNGFGMNSKKGSLDTEIKNDFNETRRQDGAMRPKSNDFQNRTRNSSPNIKVDTIISTPPQKIQHPPNSISGGKPSPKRPFTAPRPISSPPPAPVSVLSGSSSGTSSSIPVVKRPPRNRPSMPQSTWRHSAGGPPSKTRDVSGHRMSLAEPPQLNPDPKPTISPRPFPQKVIKTLRSTSLENFSNLLGENIGRTANPSATQTVSNTGSHSRQGGSVAEASLYSPAHASTLPRSTSKLSGSKSQAYMTVSPPPPPNVHHTARRTSAPLTTAHFSLIQSAIESTSINDATYANMTDIVDSAATQSKNSSRAISPPRLHPSIKAFTNHHGAVHVTSNKFPNTVSSDSLAKSVSEEQLNSSSIVPSSAKTNDPKGLARANLKCDLEAIYQNIDNVGNATLIFKEKLNSNFENEVNAKTSTDGNNILVAIPEKPKSAQESAVPNGRAKPCVAPRTKTPSSNSPSDSSKKTNPQANAVVESKDIQCTPKLSQTTAATAASTNSRAPVPSQRQSLVSDSGLNSASQQSTNTATRIEIPITHIKTEESDSSKKLSNSIHVQNRTAQSPAIDIKNSIHRSKDENRKNVDGLRPLSLSFPNSPSLLSPSSYSSTLPKNSTFKRDVRSPFRSILSTRQAEERQKQREAIYENVRSKLRESFRFEDDASRFRHDDLLLKETDELMKEALEMLNNSSLPHSLSPSLSSSFSQKFFSSPVSSLRRYDRFRSASTSEEKENSRDSVSFPKSPNHISPSSPTSKVFYDLWKHSTGKENTVTSANSSASESKTSIADFNLSGAEDTGTSIPFYDVRSGKIYDNGKEVTPVGSRNGVLPEKKDTDMTPPLQGERSSEAEVTWSERKARMDSALSWLKTELAALRDMDNVLIGQFRRCQDTIETLKTQRDVWEGLSEEGEECEYWDDYEINEFNKKYLDSPGGSSTSQLSPGSRNSSLYDVTSLASPRFALPGERRGSKGQILTSTNGVTQDVEATV